MNAPGTSAVEELLVRARRGDRNAMDELWTVLYGELRRIAHKRRGPLHDMGTLHTTALVHEAYLKIAGNTRWDGDTIAEFFSAAARAMRNILVDGIRKKQRLKRQGASAPIPMTEALELQSGDDALVLRMDAALERLERHDAELSRMVHLRYFAGLSVERVCRLMKISAATYHRDWNYAKAWMLRELNRPDVG